MTNDPETFSNRSAETVQATEMKQDNSAYPDKYGAWAGRPEGTKPDFNRCCESVWTRERWSSSNQCANKRGHGPGGAYCKIHDPAAVKARQEKSDAAYNAKHNAERYRWHGREFFNALEQIANGHNDARGLAAEVIAEFKAGERK